MIENELIRLVKSLSGSEKRNFKLHSKKQTGLKYYLDLFDIINESVLNSEVKTIESRFRKKHPKISLKNSAQYLFKLLTDSLVQTRKENDKWFQQYQGLMRSKVLFERSLTHGGYKELKKAQKLSTELQDSTIYYLTCRLELDYWSDLSFKHKTESELVQLQLNAKKALRLLHQTQEQSSLFQILKYRSIHSGKSLSNEDKAKLNDLLLTELSLITRTSQQNFETQKLHLLFQSFFFTHISDYKSALKSFYALNNLFEENESVWSSPPYDYLSTLEGVLDNLRIINHNSEIPFYVAKIKKLMQREYPESFQIVAQQTIYIYTLVVLINTGNLHEAKTLAESIPQELLTKATLVDYEKLVELLFYIGIVTFLSGDLKKASKRFSFIATIGRINTALPVYKASRLMHILVHYELSDLSYVDHEMRSYSRTFKKIKALKTEKLILQVLKFDPKRKNKVKTKMLWQKISRKCSEIEESKYERQILKYYDFPEWIKQKLHQPIG